jgi:hypothetical protein
MKLYIFVGMYQGINDRVEPYVYEADAEKAWSDYTERSYADFKEDDTLLNDTHYEGSTIYETDFPMDCYDSARKIAIIWNIDDVQMNRPDLNDEQALEVLEKALHKHDASIGVSWTTLEEWADYLFPLSPDERTRVKLIIAAANLYMANADESADYTIHDALQEASGIHEVTDLHNSENGEYEDLVYGVKKILRLAA